MNDETTTSPASDAWYEQVFEAAPDATVIVGADEKIQLLNRQTERLFGYARSELVGLPLGTLIPERLRQSHARHVARFFSMPVAETRPMGSGLELVGRRKDGAEMPVEVSLSPLRSRATTLICAAIRDISARRRMQAEAKCAADRLASAVESVQDGFALFDADDKIVLGNAAFRALFGDALSGSLVGRGYAEMLDAWMTRLAFSSPRDRERFRAERIAERCRPERTFDVRTLDGRSLRVTDRCTREGGHVTTIWDMTDDVRMAEQLAAARVAAEASSAAKSEFLSSMSHELRTPLNAILGFAQLLGRDKKEPLSQRHLARLGHIVAGGEHLLRLVDDVLDLSSIEAGRVSLSVEPVSVPQVIADVTATLEPLALQAGLSLEDVPVEDGVPFVAADRTKFVQILMNLGSNAIKYNRANGSVTFTASRLGANGVRVVVADTGFGIPLEKQEKLFQPFQRGGHEAGPIEGTGIGLVITKRLAELMHGSVGFRSTFGEGSEFWVDLPADTAPVRRASSREAVLEATDTLQVEDSRVVLYVEDNPANVSFMQDLLGNFDGVELVTAPTAEMGVELARDRLPTAIIMDINLPGMNGFDALRALKQTNETASIPVVALTASTSERDKQRGEQAGFFRYLTKPVRVDELEAVLEALLTSETSG